MQKFNPGQVVITKGIRNLIESNPERKAEIMSALDMHCAGNWGIISEDDIATNEEELLKGGSLMSAYMLSFGKIWIFTEHDRSVTTVLLPEEY